MHNRFSLSNHPARVSLIFIGLTLLFSAAFQISSLRPAVSQLILHPYTVLIQGRIWQLITHIFVIPQMLSLLFELLFFWFVAVPLEAEMGSSRFLRIFAAATLGGGTAVLLMPYLGLPPIHFFSPGAMLLLSVWLFSRRNPEQQFLIMLVIPVKAKYFLFFYIGLRLFLALDQPVYYYMLIAEFSGCGAGLLVNHLLANRSRRREIHHRKNIESRRNIAEQEQSAVEQRNRVLGRSEPDKEQLQQLLAGRPSFAVCPADEFKSDDPHCLKCHGYGYCLARSKQQEK